MSTPKLKIYQDVDSLCLLPKKIASEIESLQEKVVILLFLVASPVRKLQGKYYLN